MTAILGVLLLIGGFYFYTQAAPQWQQAQSWLGQIAGAISPNVRQQIETIRMWYFGSIGAMILGGLLTIAGLADAISASAKSQEKRGNRIVEGIAAVAIIYVLFVLLNGALRSTSTHQGPPPAASAPVLRAAPAPTYDAPEPQGSSTYVEAPAPTGEAVDVLNKVKSSEWTYYQQYGTFTRNMRSLGITAPLGSQYLYSIPRANQSQVIITATGRILTHASGIKLALFLNADGTARIVRYR